VSNVIDIYPVFISLLSVATAMNIHESSQYSASMSNFLVANGLAVHTWSTNDTIVDGPTYYVPQP
jgi:uncharacterized membrane protein